MINFFDTLSLRVLDRAIKVQCEDKESWTLLTAAYGEMRDEIETAHLNYTAGRQRGTGAFFLKRKGEEPQLALDDGEFLFFFEKEITVELQKLRPDLYFVHGAVLEFRGKALMLVGASGSGKSTTTWALLHHGFRYLSDELAPVDLTTLEVYPYPHALCLKNEPPVSYPLPLKTIRTSRTLHIPVGALPGGVATAAFPLVAIFFLRYRRERPLTTIEPITQAVAAARLIANALNPLAHPGYGLDAAVEMASRTACFEIFRGDLHETSALVKDTTKRVVSSSGQRWRSGSK